MRSERQANASVAKALCVALVVLATLTACQKKAPLQSTELLVHGHAVQAEVAETAADHAAGLMHRRSLGPNAGMLFVFEEPRAVCMWMKNTEIPLSVAFIDQNGFVVNVADMEPHSEAMHCAERPARYVLEVNKGWLASRGVSRGSAVRGKPISPPKGAMT